MEDLKAYNIIKTLDEICKDIFTGEPFRFEWLPEPVFFQEERQYILYEVAKRKVKYDDCIYDFESHVEPTHFCILYQVPKTDKLNPVIQFESPSFEIFTLNGYLRQGKNPLFMNSMGNTSAIHVNRNLDVERQHFIDEMQYIKNRFKTLNYYESLDGDYIARNIKTLEWHNLYIDTASKLQPDILRDIILYLKQQYHPELINFKDMAWLI